MRFLHTADWQLGMRRHFLDGDAQARFGAARVDAITTLGTIATAERCDFVMVAGDMFESNHVDRRTLRRALEALATVTAPVYLLPGNHDPLDAGSIFTSPAFTEACPDHVHVLTDSTPRSVGAGFELVGVPWPSKRPAHDLVGAVIGTLAPTPGVQRIVVGHGAVADGVFATSATAISLAGVEAALADGRIAYVGLGDRHSTTSVGRSGRVWYSGAPEPTDFDEVDPGNVLVVELGPDTCQVERVPVAGWKFLRFVAEVAGRADVEALAQRLASVAGKERTIVRLGVRGTLDLRDHTRLINALDDARTVFAALDDWHAESDLVVLPDDADFAALDLTGFARAALDALVAQCSTAGPEGSVARDALGLLHRLVA